MIKRLKIANGSLIACESGDSPIQIYISPTQEERSILNSTFNIDEHTLSSSLDPDEIPRIEFDPDYTLLIWKYPLNYSGQDNFFFNVASIGFFIIKNKLIIITKDDISFPNQGSRQMHRMNSINDVLLTLLYGTIHHYFEHLKIIRLISGELQQ